MKKEKKSRKGKQILGSLLFVLFVWELFVCFTNSVCNLLPNCPSTIKLGPTHKDSKLRLNQNSVDFQCMGYTNICTQLLSLLLKH